MVAAHPTKQLFRGFYALAGFILFKVTGFQHLARVICQHQAFARCLDQPARNYRYLKTSKKLLFVDGISDLKPMTRQNCRPHDRTHDQGPPYKI